MTAPIRVDATKAMADQVGEAHGITADELADIAARVRDAHGILADERARGIYGFWDLYKQSDVLADVKRRAQPFAGMDNLAILGIGGSALGARALGTALLHPYHNLLDRDGRGGRPRLFVMDNIDPDTFAAMMAICPPEKTVYNVISKSGGTAETMSQLLLVVDALEDAVGAANLKNHVVVTTNPRAHPAPPSLLHPVADEYGLESFDVPLNVGGRFSVFSPVGLFPAVLLGMDVDALFAGCAAMDARCATTELDTNPAYLHAAMQYLAATRKGKSISVMMPYADALSHVADWYAQLWAESLGKRHSLDSVEVFAGQTPVKAVGATDQHSQIQLYREGPNDKIINIVAVESFKRTLTLPHKLESVPQLGYLRGATMNALMAAECQGTADALTLSERPVVQITLPEVNAHTVAQLLYMLEVETAMAGRLFNVNTFDQPGVEEGKRIARRLMGGQG